ncbi:MAG: hypothetical protein B0W54_17870 [Cellvibrio sp. 79]|nr:MAG: hypothetical protein B0W54_17870 [Cellvibrio sp. 79]
MISLVKASAIFVLSLYCHAINATNSTISHLVNHPITTAQQTPDNFADLAPLGEAIGNKRIVMLDELTHGEGNVFQLKTRIVEYLHQKKGFNLFVIESGFFDVARLWQQQQSIRQLAPGNIFYMYANSAEVWPLFDYIDASRTTPTPLVLAGFDGRLSGNLSKQKLVPQLKTFLEKQKIQAEKNNYLQQLQSLLDGNLEKADAATQKKFLVSNSALDQALQQLKQKSSLRLDAGFWQRINASVRMMAEVAWQQKHFDEHDLAMAGNLQWLAEEAYPDSKIIVWGHYIHLNRKGGFRGSLHHPEYVHNMASALPTPLLEKTYVLHFAGASGEYIDFGDLQKIHVNAPTTLLEETLNRDINAAIFIDMKTNANGKKLPPLWGHEYKTTLDWQDAQQRFDGMILLKQITPASYHTPKAPTEN